VPVVIAASRRPCAASRTTITGRTRCGARSRRQQGRPAAVRQRRARHHRGRAPAGGAPAVESLTDIRGTAFMVRGPRPGWFELDSTDVDRRPHRRAHQPLSDNGRGGSLAGAGLREGRGDSASPVGHRRHARVAQAGAVTMRARPSRHPHPRLRAGEERRVLYAHANRCCTWRPSRQRTRTGATTRERDVWINPPPIR